ncbi:MAG: 1,4-dihydroxy-2-naphthoate polyprenyltransferase [Streptomycetaceae bacterium]|nr:1,4-dihydroxy-2-naphthoate polyprenyltransferase [Streptomycetaceae bacterium]
MNKWVLGARVRTLPAAIAPVVVASSLAGSEFNWSRSVLALTVGIWLQIGVNFANDYSDGIKGTDDDRVGPIRLVASGLASANSVKTAALVSFLIASIAGLWLSLLTSFVLIPIGLICIAAAWGYTGGKNPYGYRGFGEISVFIFFGIVATVGSFYVQTEKITLMSFIVAIPMGALSCAILTVNNIRDLDKDKFAGKRTFAVRVGDSKARRIYVSLLILAHIAAVATFIPATLLTLIAAPLTFTLSKLVLSQASGASLIPALSRTGKLQLLFATLFAIALAIQ